VAYTIITGTAVSGDADYNGLDPADVSGTNLDNDGGAGWSTLFNPDQVTLDLTGSGASVSIFGENLPTGVDAVQVQLLHPDAVQVTLAECAGVFAGGLSIPPTESATAPGTGSDRSSLFGCYLVGQDISNNTGEVMTFHLERVGAFTEDQVVSFGLVGELGTQYSDGGVVIAPGTTNHLVVSSVATGVTLSGSVDLEFCDAPATCFPITVELEGAGTSVQTSADAAGNWTLESVSPGTYTLTASASGHLSREQQGLVVGASDQVVATTELLGGDLDGNAYVNIQDISGMASKFGQPSTNCAVDGLPADLDCNGLVDINDLTGAVGNFGAAGPTPWQE
jgi:hypothetical protein